MPKADGGDGEYVTVAGATVVVGLITTSGNCYTDRPPPRLLIPVSRPCLERQHCSFTSQSLEYPYYLGASRPRGHSLLLPRPSTPSKSIPASGYIAECPPHAQAYCFWLLHSTFPWHASQQYIHTPSAHSQRQSRVKANCSIRIRRSSYFPYHTSPDLSQVVV